MASEDNFVIRIKGQGTHAARPHMGVDPIVIASEVVLALQTVISRNLDPSVGSPLVLAAQSASQVQADIDITRATTAMEAADAIARGASLRAQALGQKGQAFASRTSASTSRLAASNARLAGHIGAGVALLKGAAAAYNMGGSGAPVPTGG